MPDVVEVAAPPPPNGPAKPPARPPAAVEVDDTVNVLAPSPLMESATALLEPVPTATRMITAATPIMIPRVVRADRVLLAVTP